MRLFVALDLDDDARRAIAAEQQRLMQEVGDVSRSSLRWVRPDRMHLTLDFLGEVEDSRADAVIAAMRGDVEAAPFTIVYAGLGVFPPHGAPSVVWVGVAQGQREVVGVQRQVAERLAQTGAERDPRPYHPHLTLARWRRSRPADRRRVLAADRGTEVARVDVEAVMLYRSQLSSAGPRYTELARAHLRP